MNFSKQEIVKKPQQTKEQQLEWESSDMDGEEKTKSIEIC